jgi:hypothetical protein
MAQFLGTRCHCGQVAVIQRTIRSYRAAGRLTEREAGLLLPRADKPPVGPLCVHHMLRFLEERLGKGIKARFWDGRLNWPRNVSQCRRRVCAGHKTNGAPCAAPAMKGALYCQATTQVERAVTASAPGAAAARLLPSARVSSASALS